MTHQTDTQRQCVLRTVPGFRGPHPGIQLGTHVSHQASDEDLQFLQQLDMPWAMVTVDDPAAHRADGSRRLQDRLAPYGLQIYRVANHSVHNVEEITLNLPGRQDRGVPPLHPQPGRRRHPPGRPTGVSPGRSAALHLRHLRGGTGGPWRLPTAPTSACACAWGADWRAATPWART